MYRLNYIYYYTHLILHCETVEKCLYEPIVGRWSCMPYNNDRISQHIVTITTSILRYMTSCMEAGLGKAIKHLAVYTK